METAEYKILLYFIPNELGTVCAECDPTLLFFTIILTIFTISSVVL